MSMKNKKVLIVGGSRGIGEGVVNKFASFGANVYYFSRQKKKKVAVIFEKANLETLLQKPLRPVSVLYHQSEGKRRVPYEHKKNNGSSIVFEYF